MSGKRGKRRGGRARSGGVLSRMRDTPKRARRRKTGPARTLVEWTLGLLAALIILAAVAILGIRFFKPDVGAEIREATVTVDEIVPAETAGLDRPVPVVSLERSATWLRVAPSVPTTPRAGDRVHVTYEYKPITGAVTVRSWSPAEPADAADTDDVAGSDGS